MSIALRTLVDGVEREAALAQDRGLHYGDGLFETLRVRGGRIRHEADHRARLADGCRRLSIAVDLDRTWSTARDVAAQQGEATLRLQVTRGDAVQRGYTPTGQEVARTLLSVFPALVAGELPTQVAVCTLQATLGENPLLAGLKHCNRLEQVLGRLELQSRGGFEGLMGSSSGLLVSGTMSNVFLALDGELVTPAIDRCGVAGVMRTAVLRQAQAQGIIVHVAALPMAALARCTGLALSNARMGLVPAHTLDGRPLERSGGLHELAARMNE